MTPGQRKHRKRVKAAKQRAQARVAHEAKLRRVEHKQRTAVHPDERREPPPKPEPIIDLPGIGPVSSGPCPNTPVSQELATLFRALRALGGWF